MSDMSARNIKNYRKRKNMTQAELAEKVGVSLMSIRRYETKGENNREPSADLFDKIAEVLDTRANVLRGKESDYEFRDIPQGPIANAEITKKYIGEKAVENIERILRPYSKLNDTGKDKAVEQVEMLVKIPEYRKGD